MRKSKFNEEQIIGILREAEGETPVQAVCARHNISDATFYKWRAKYGGLGGNEAPRVRGLGEGKKRFERVGGHQAGENPIFKGGELKKRESPWAKRGGGKVGVEGAFGVK